METGTVFQISSRNKCHSPSSGRSPVAGVRVDRFDVPRSCVYVRVFVFVFADPATPATLEHVRTPRDRVSVTPMLVAETESAARTRQLIGQCSPPSFTSIPHPTLNDVSCSFCRGGEKLYALSSVITSSSPSWSKILRGMFVRTALYTSFSFCVDPNIIIRRLPPRVAISYTVAWSAFTSCLY